MIFPFNIFNIAGLKREKNNYNLSCIVNRPQQSGQYQNH
jgi:hypothetical protein